MSQSLDTNAKALRINLDSVVYGTFAEIGGGQEISRWFFRVGGAAGTVAKTMSAYDMTVSDAIYGRGSRYVSRERLASMLDHEYALLIERLTPSRGPASTFFVLADTVATRSFKGTNESHGWLGLRFQHAPLSAPSQIVLHVSLLEPTAQLQQQTLGVLGVNLLYAAFYSRRDRAELLKSLLDDLPPNSVEIDVAELSGPAFAWSTAPLAVAADLLTQRLTPAVLFDEAARMDQPSSVVRKRPLIVHRASLASINPELSSMFNAAAHLLAHELSPTAPAPDTPTTADRPAAPPRPLHVLEASISGMLEKQTPNADDIADRLAQIVVPGRASMITSFAENFRVSTYLRRLTHDPLRYIMGLDAVVTTLRARFYTAIDGGLLEGLGRLLPSDTRLYVYSMPADTLRARFQRAGIDDAFCPIPDRDIVRVSDLHIAPPAGHLLAFLRDARWVVQCDPVPAA